MTAARDESAFLVAIEGVDGSGKGTQAARLHQRLQSTGLRAALFSFPRYSETLFGRSVGDFLNGRFGQLNQVHPCLASLLYAGDRFESRDVLLAALAANDVVICDRYVPSNIAHQACKVTGAERDELTAWIQNIEYGVFRLPRPDAVVLLDVPIDTAQELIAAKRPRGYTSKPADLHEADADYLRAVQDLYHQLAATDAHWHTVPCVSGGCLQTIEEISDDVFQVVETGRTVKSRERKTPEH